MKKTEIITAAITEETKRTLEQIAKTKEWTLSFTINKILEDFIVSKADPNAENQKNKEA